MRLSIGSSEAARAMRACWCGSSCGLGGFGRGGAGTLGAAVSVAARGPGCGCRF